MNRLFSARQMTLPAPLLAFVERIAQQWRGSLLQRGWRLWLVELRACMPEKMQRLLIHDTPQHLHAWPLVAPLPVLLSSVQQILLLPSSAVLMQTLQLPLAAARDLNTVVGYELDRFTPFDASQLYFVARQEKRSGAFIQVTLVAILRERLDAILNECAALGLQPYAVDVGNDESSRLQVDLLPAPLRPRQQRNGLGLQRKLLWLCGGLLLVAMLLWLNNRQQLLDEMESTVQAQRAQVAQIQKIRQQLTNTRGAASYLIQRKAAQPTFAALLNELTACLPRDTWIDQFEINDSAEVSFSGQSAKASALISRVKDCHSLDNAQFQGVIQPDPQTGKDRFSLRAHLHQEAAHAPTTDQP
ncbi:general secretion pathway protein GspL [Pseudomonas sp. S25]|uniref:General secretion pathway protein GspL n=1 Tax=Pseudomonas maioricensis TaxID=1766623 RepID=A0ABS9ZNT7_9PSED|nr:PilN domain-containing protein [Pseudomonas sp. S25]MCI8212248.1 general secretion pathway protein GspL [Pseudomonas sp. S25]